MAQSACKIPTEADELWITAVRTRPAAIPRIGFENISKIFVNSGTSCRGFTAALIASIPVIKIAKPIKMPPMSFFFSLLENIRKIIPSKASSGEKELGFNNLIKRFPLSIPDKLKIQEVIVVPILAPMIIPIAWDSFIIPEFTKPTTITVVAEEDWMTAVTNAPSPTAFKRLEVNFSNNLSNRPPENFSNNLSNRPPESFSRPFPMVSIPYRNNARPPNNENTLKISMSYSFILFHVVLLPKFIIK